MQTQAQLTPVEEHFLALSGRKLQYSPAEKISVLEVQNFPTLGKLTALRFVEWVQANPGGVVSLPTGKTPEFFIKWVTFFVNTWEEPSTQTLLTEHGIDVAVRPDMASLHFVQMDDFYPIDPSQHNSFYHYVNKFYIKGFGLDPNKCLLMDTWHVGCPPGKTARDVFPDGNVDLSLRHRQPKSPEEFTQRDVIYAIDQFCSDYEARIRSLGGIGFFMGGIGPDGHIAFNIRGSDRFSTTRLTATNYETQAAAASDLGGIELARKTLVITIGLETITYKPDSVSIIGAAGEAKARIVGESIQCDTSNRYPASALHGRTHSRFYLTQSATVHLSERVYEKFVSVPAEQLSEKQKHRVIIDLALSLKTRVTHLTQEQLKGNRFTNYVMSGQGSVNETRQLLKDVEAQLRKKVQLGMEALPPTTFFHTAPHHDDIMLGYLPSVIHQVRPPTNRHTFAYATSGFNAVTNSYVIGLVHALLGFLQKEEFVDLLEEGYFDPENRVGYFGDVYHALDGVAARDENTQLQGVCRRLLRIIMTVYNDHTVDQCRWRCNEMLTYLRSRYPGQKDSPEFQKIKGMIREMEADLLWGYFGFSEHVQHLRLGFYKGDYFTESPTPSRDVAPILEIIRAKKPDVVTVAFDPEGSGPDTHYKVMQAVCQALRFYANEADTSHMQVWGYRNVWYRFHPNDADLMVPVSLNSMAIMDDTFDRCFGSQRSASFPAAEYDGPFSGYAQFIQAEQLQMLKASVGSAFFEESDLHLLKRTHGLCFLRKMSLEEFFAAARDLEEQILPKGSNKHPVD